MHCINDGVADASRVGHGAVLTKKIKVSLPAGMHTDTLGDHEIGVGNSTPRQTCYLHHSRDSDIDQTGGTPERTIR